MATQKKPASKAASATPTKKKEAVVSKVKPGTGSRRITRRAVCIYGPGKTHKTGCLARLIQTQRVKFIAADPNALPTLSVLDAVPADEDLYEPADLHATCEILENWLQVAEAAEQAGEDPVEALGFDFGILDSLTSLLDWHKQDIAKQTGQRFMGDDAKNNGWQQFNAEFGRLMDLLVSLTKYVHIIAIAHAKDREPNSQALQKTQWAGMALSPEMALKASRLFNWILFKSYGEVIDDGSKVLKEDEYMTKVESRGETKWYESILHTKPFGTFMASANLKPANAATSEWPGDDLLAMFEAEGLVQS